MGQEIINKYFLPGTRGYNILRNFYHKYKDLFIKTVHPEFDDFLNQVLTNVASINFSEEIKNVEAYIIGTIKIQCRVQIDKAIKEKNKLNLEVKISEEEPDDEENHGTIVPSRSPNPYDEVETQEIFHIVNRFKLSLKLSDVELLNNLIDELPRKEIAEKLNSNLNTLDTQIRRLRIKFLTYLKNSGYTYKIFERFKND